MRFSSTPLNILSLNFELSLIYVYALRLNNFFIISHRHILSLVTPRTDLKKGKNDQDFCLVFFFLIVSEEVLMV